MAVRTGPFLDLAFHLTGPKIPVDHGYTLYAALCPLLPKDKLHDHDAEQAGFHIGIHPIRGRYVGGEHLHLASFSRLILRLPQDRIKDYLKLAGKRLDLEDCALRIGVCDVRTLIPAASLRARFVTTRNGQDEARFREECERQIKALGVSGKLSVGQRRTMRIHGKQIVGYSVVVTELTTDESLALQEKGLGGRRKMGCGIFVPMEASK